MAEWGSLGLRGTDCCCSANILSVRRSGWISLLSREFPAFFPPPLGLTLLKPKQLFHTFSRPFTFLSSTQLMRPPCLFLNSQWEAVLDIEAKEVWLVTVFVLYEKKKILPSFSETSITISYLAKQVNPSKSLINESSLQLHLLPILDGTVIIFGCTPATHNNIFY